MSVLLRGVRPYGEGERVDVLVDDGQIAAIGAGLHEAGGLEKDIDVIDATGQILLPGFVDLHTHLREPGREYAETIETGSAAAALGGYTAVFAMANTNPVADSPVVTDHVWHRGQQVGLVDVHPVGAVTVGLAGTELTEMGMMAAGAAQVRMFSDDGKCVYDPLVMRRALEYATGLGVLIAQHAEEPRLTVGAVAHEGPNAARLGLSGWPRAAEESIVARDALLAREPAPGCTSATHPRRAPSRSSDRLNPRVFRSPPRSRPITCCSTTVDWPATTASTGSTRRYGKPPTRRRCVKRWPTG